MRPLTHVRDLAHMMGWARRMQGLPFDRSFEDPFSRQIITCKSFALWSWLEHQKNHEKSFTVSGIRKPLRHWYEDFRSLAVKRIILRPLLLKIIFTYTLQWILHGLAKSAEKLLAEQTVWVSLSKLFSGSSINPISLNDQLNNTLEARIAKILLDWRTKAIGSEGSTHCLISESSN